MCRLPFVLVDVKVPHHDVLVHHGCVHGTSIQTESVPKNQYGKVVVYSQVVKTMRQETLHQRDSRLYRLKSLA